MNKYGFHECPSCGNICLPRKTAPLFFIWECGCCWYSPYMEMGNIDNIEIPDEFDKTLWEDINGHV